MEQTTEGPQPGWNHSWSPTVVFLWNVCGQTLLITLLQTGVCLTPLYTTVIQYILYGEPAWSPYKRHKICPPRVLVVLTPRIWNVCYAAEILLWFMLVVWMFFHLKQKDVFVLNRSFTRAGEDISPVTMFYHTPSMPSLGWVIKGAFIKHQC